MDERALLTGLLLTSIFNTILLVVVSVVLLRFLSTMARVGRRAESLLEQVEREVLSTLVAARNTVNIMGTALSKGTYLVERYLMLHAWKQVATGNKWSKLIAGTGLGYGIAKALLQLKGDKRA